MQRHIHMLRCSRWLRLRRWWHRLRRDGICALTGARQRRTLTADGSIKFVTMGSGFLATNPQAAVYWNPANTVSGTYTLKGTFTLMKPSGHTNYYGLVFGGSDLEGPQQKYLYFVVAQNGTWLIKRRDGDANTENVSSKTASEGGEEARRQRKIHQCPGSARGRR